MLPALFYGPALQAFLQSAFFNCELVSLVSLMMMVKSQLALDNLSRLVELLFLSLSVHL